MASLGNVGHNVPMARAETEAWYAFTFDKQPTSVDMAGTGVNASTVPGAFMSLYRNSILNARSRADSSGNWHFYDMDDSGSQVYTIVAFTQSGPTGELWSASVVGAVATVTKLFAAQRAIASAFT